MAYSNDQTQIRAGLVNYIGALLNSSVFEEKAARQNVAAILTEEIVKIAQDEDKVVDLYVLKPMFKAMEYVLGQRIIELSKLPKSISADQVVKYQTVKTALEELTEKI